MFGVLTACMTAVALWTIAAVSPAVAAYPGQNGKLAAVHTPGHLPDGIYLIDPATGDYDHIGGGSLPGALAWSPDGRRIAYQSREVVGTTPQPGEIRVINSDGTGDMALASHPADDGTVSWSPDGTRLVFDSARAGFGLRELYTMDADGTNVQRLTNLEELEGQAHSPAWSPDGTKIAYIGRVSTLPWRLRIINADGTGDQVVTPEGFDVTPPDWAPDGSRVVFKGWPVVGEPGRFFTIKPDGSHLTPLPNTADDPDSSPMIQHYGPHFSPDGTRIVFGRNEHIPNAGWPSIVSQRLDGSDRRTIVDATDVNAGFGGADWQPIPYNGYARPKAAGPLRVALVTAFKQCNGPDRVPPDGQPNRIHGPPLDHPSCNPPVTYSATVVGSFEPTGTPSNSVGFVRYRPIVGVPGGADDADVSIGFDVTDVLCRREHGFVGPTCGAPNGSSAGTPQDYVGELQVTVGVRITDRDNGGPPDAGTMQDAALSLTAPCAETPSITSAGSTCSTTTTADALIPGVIKEGERAIWMLDQVTVLDGGLDGDVESAPAENAVFLRQGVFVP